MDCTANTTKGDKCQKKSVPGLEIDEACLCKHHWMVLMLNMKLKELGISDAPATEEKEVVPCNQITKKDGKPCPNHAALDCEGMCKLHWSHKVRNEKKETESTESAAKPREKCNQLTESGKECNHYEAENCDGMCKRHWNKKQKETVQEPPAAPVKRERKKKEPVKEAKQIIIDRAALLGVDAALESKVPPLPITTDGPFGDIQLPEGF